MECLFWWSRLSVQHPEIVEGEASCNDRRHRLPDSVIEALIYELSQSYDNGSFTVTFTQSEITFKEVASFCLSER